ncbi:hypothetical protein C1H46_000613 [Malus baccata]|uniref:Uncharacterized protein n=1 Tax=Malus baccata TaxID=106549 RepID=A0A540NRD6_MALBA|nr:hypothetical protein C1H46_000613 [Malus baccata]
MLNTPRRSEMKMKNKAFKIFQSQTPKNQMDPRMVFIKRVDFQIRNGTRKATCHVQKQNGKV